MPEIRTAFKALAPAGEFGFGRPEEIEVWNDSGTWRKIEFRPKYPINVAVDKDLADQLADEVLSAESKASLVAAKASVNILAEERNRTEIAELAKAETSRA
jgi:hypothetical protein